MIRKKIRQWFNTRVNRAVDRALADTLARWQAMPPHDRWQDAQYQAVMNALAWSPTVFGGGIDRVTLGAQVVLVNTLLNVSSGRISIDDHSFFGHNVMLLTGTHFTEAQDSARQDFPTTGRDIVIGQGVWVASGATVIGPCVIEDHVVVGAGAVVTGGVLKRGWLYAGVPARAIRQLLVAE